MTTSRVLPPDEWGRLPAEAGLDTLLPLMDPEQTEVHVVEDGERIVACWSVLRVTHLEGIWVDPAYRNAGVCRRLMRSARRAAEKWCGGWAITAATTDEVRGMIERVGGIKIQADSYALALGGK